MPTILAIDTSTGPCSVAIWSDGRITAYVENAKPIMQSASLMPMVEQALSESKLTYKDLSLVACTVGPGSFTGIRVGLASARGIAFAAGILSAGYTTLEVLAFAAKATSGTVMAVLNAGKGEYYMQRFAAPALAPLSEPELVTPEQAKATAPGCPIIGNIAFDHLIPDITFPRADALAELAARALLPAQALRPFYIRAPDAKLPKKA